MTETTLTDLSTAKKCACKWCGTLFNPHRGKKFCSSKCKSKHNNAKHEYQWRYIQCEACGKQIKTLYPRQRTCDNPACKQAVQRERYYRIKKSPIIDPVREPYVQAQIVRYGEIMRILKEHDISMDMNSLYVDRMIERLKRDNVKFPE